MDARIATITARPPITPGGPVAAVVVSLAPLIFLLLVTLVKPLQLPSRTSLPVTAVLMAVVQLAYLANSPSEVAGMALAGCLQAITPLSVVFGAILLFQSMHVTGCMAWLMHHVKAMCHGSPVAETFLIGWSFSMLLEGIGGFGAPVALGAPMLVSLGHDPLRAIVVVVVLNSLVSYLGSVGLVVWFAFQSLGLGSANILLIGAKSAVMMALPTLAVAPLAASMMCSWAELRAAWGFIAISLLSGIVPAFLVATQLEDMPIMLGGICSLLVTTAALRFGVGIRLGSAGDIVAEKASQQHSSQHNRCVSSSSSVSRSRSPFQDAALALARAQRTAAVRAAAEDALALALTLSHDCTTDTACAGAGTSSLCKSKQRQVGCSPPCCNDAGRDVDSDTEDLQGYVAITLPADSLAGEAITLCSRARSEPDRRNGPSAAHGETAPGNLIHRAASSFQPHLSASGRSIVLHGAGSCHGMPSSSPAAAAGRRTSARLVQQLPTSCSTDVAAMTAMPTPLVVCLDSCRGGRSTHLDLEADRVNDTGGHRDQLVDCLAATAAPQALPAPRSLKSFSQKHRGHSGVVLVPGLGLREVLLRSLPITLTIFVLLIARIPAFKIKAALSSDQPSLSVQLGTLGRFSLSASLVVQLTRVLGTAAASFRYETLAVPCILPFVLASVVTLAVHHASISLRGVAGWVAPFREAWVRTAGTAAAMAGALALASLMRSGGTGSPAYVLGYYLSTWMGKGFMAVTGLLGALSTFISGSVMAGNIAFGPIQFHAAQIIALPVTSILALQNAGCCAGKMVCIANLLSAKAVMNLHAMPEALFIRFTALPALLTLLLATVSSLLFMFPIGPGGTMLWPDAPLPAHAL